MKRRQFFKAGAGASAAVSINAGGSTAAQGASPTDKSGLNTPPILASYGAEDHRRRLQNIALCESGIRKFMGKHLITDYIPGQCTYNLGEYPCRKEQLWDPDDWDEQELDRLHSQGIRLVQVHEEWNDAQRLHGSHKLAPANPAGFRRFVEMVHKRGMKLIVYVSTGFFERTDPDFREEWARQQDLVELWFHYARCSPASPSWRAYLLPRLFRIMDEYGVDGFYNDAGYVRLAENPRQPTSDEVLAFDEGADHDGAEADLLELIYSEVKRRKGIVKLHFGSTRRPQTAAKVYDYLWVGEGGGKADTFREAIKNHPPYVVPCLDMSRATISKEDDLYLHAIPYMQFPLLLAGRPFTGERAVIPGIKYKPAEKDFWGRHLQAIWKYYQAHPNGPFSYGYWDSVPGRPEARSTHANWLKQYLPMAEEGTWAWLEITDSDLFARSLPEGVVASVFANRELFLVLANYSSTPIDVKTSAQYVANDTPEAAPSQSWNLPGRSLHILRRHV